MSSRKSDKKNYPVNQHGEHAGASNGSRIPSNGSEVGTVNDKWCSSVFLFPTTKDKRPLFVVQFSTFRFPCSVLFVHRHAQNASFVLLHQGWRAACWRSATRLPQRRTFCFTFFYRTLRDLTRDSWQQRTYVFPVGQREVSVYETRLWYINSIKEYELFSYWTNDLNKMIQKCSILLKTKKRDSVRVSFWSLLKWVSSKGCQGQ